MFQLPASLRAWPSAEFAAVLKSELEALGAAPFPLQQAVSMTSYALETAPTVMVIASQDDADRIEAKLGVFFSGIVAGCSCADDPTPVEPQNEYCEMRLLIRKADASATLTVADSAA